MMWVLSEISGNVCPSLQVSDLQNGLVCLCGLEFPKEKLSVLQEEWQSTPKEAPVLEYTPSLPSSGKPVV